MINPQHGGTYERNAAWLRPVIDSTILKFPMAVCTAVYNLAVSSFTGTNADEPP